MQDITSRTHNNIAIIGLGVAEHACLDKAACEALCSADIVIGSARQLKTVAAYTQQLQKIKMPKLTQLKAVISEFSGLKIAVLASGDPLYFGIGRWFFRHYPRQYIQCYAAVSSIQAACNRLGIALQDADVVSLHGRPLASLKIRLKRNCTLIVLTDKRSAPKYLAEACIEANFSDSRISICEDLGYASETLHTVNATELVNAKRGFSDLNLCVIEVLGLGNVQPEFPGIPDHHFHTGDTAGKGMITKREVRLCILSFMQLSAGDVVWDIGAGCGGVAVEMAYWQPKAQVHALECHPCRLGFLRENRQRFGVVNNLHILEGRAPAALAQLPRPGKVFIGGSGGHLPELLEATWHLLPEQGVLVVSAVVESTKRILAEFATQRDSGQVECVELSVKRATFDPATATSPAQLSYAAKLPVEIFKFTKTVNAL